MVVVQDPADTIVGMAFTSTSSSRGSILAALTGVVLLGLLVAFSLGLSAVADDDAHGDDATSASGSGPIELPEVLPGNLVSPTSDALPAAIAGQFDLDELTKRLDNGVAGLTDLYDAPSAFGVYTSTDGTKFATLAVVGVTGGLFLPDNLPPFDEVALGGTAPATQVIEKVDGGICSASLLDPSTGQPLADPSVPSSVTCQYTDDVRTYQIDAQGLTEQEAVAAAKGVSAYLAGDEDAVPDAADVPPAPAAPAPSN